MVSSVQSGILCTIGPSENDNYLGALYFMLDDRSSIM